jgi:hypothetical protein
MHAQHTDRISIRLAAPADADAMRRLALLDSTHAEDGDALVAEVGGRIQAALELGSDHVIADPFEPTAELATLLQLRARQLRSAA